MNKETKVSVVIPSFNGKDLLKKHLPKVLLALNNWQKQGWEVIVVDDASTDNTVQFLRESFPEVRVIANEKNLRFGHSCNKGVRAARGEIIILLNNDVSPKKDFLTPLIKNFRGIGVFAVGCRERQPGKKLDYGRGEMFFKRGLMIHRRADSQKERTTDWVSGGSGAFDRTKWLYLGGMDGLFRPAYEEDRDLSYRAVKGGFKVLFEPESVVFHHHETTNKKVFGQKKMRIISYKNHFLFVWKNITDTKLLLNHFIWLPYHLIINGFRTNGEETAGFIWALSQLPEAVKSRSRVKRFFKKKDKEIIR